ncbi:MAG: hypothetical protein KDB27_22160 [Planctomycetales bacterium]|nr:hypothetical protein [Planctomycetales bacterium]
MTPLICVEFGNRAGIARVSLFAIALSSIAFAHADAKDHALVPPEPPNLVANTVHPQQEYQPPIARSADATQTNRSDKHVAEIELALALPDDDRPPQPDILVRESAPRCCGQGLCYSVYDPAIGFCHHPLYFEHTRAERFGASHRPFDSMIGGVHFFGNVALLPVKIVVARPRSCVATWQRLR